MADINQLKQAVGQEFIAYLEWLNQQDPGTVVTPPTVEESPEIVAVAFIYDIDELFEDVKMRSAIRAKSLRDDKGNTNVEAYTVTGDERLWFDKTMKTGAGKVYNILAYLGKKFPTPFVYDDGPDTPTGDPLVDLKGKIMYLAETSENIPAVAWVMADNHIREALILYTLKEWYKIVGLMEEAALKEQELTESILSARSNANLRVKPVARPVTHFGI